MADEEKFTFVEFKRSEVVNAKPHFQSTSEEIFESFVEEIAVEHIANIVSDGAKNVEETAKGEGDELKNGTNKNEDSKKQEEAFSQDQEQMKNVITEKQLDEAYKKGIAETKEEYEQKIKLLEEKKSFSELIEKKISEIIPAENFELQVIKISSEAISHLARKLHLVLPTNFVDVITKAVAEKIGGFYKEGDVVLVINPERYDFCVELLKIDLISEKFRDKIKIEKDEKLSMNDCIVKYSDTVFEYKTSQIAEEIENVIKQLQVTT